MKFNHLQVSRLLQRLIFVIFNLLLFVLPFVFTWSNQELFEFNKILFLYSMTVLLLLLWGLRMILEKKRLLRRTPLDIFLLAFLASQILATLLSIHFRTSIFGYYSRFNGGLLSFAAYLALYYVAVNNLQRRQLPIMLESLLLSALLVSLYAIPEHFGASPSCWLINRQWDVDCWRQQVQVRVFASFGQPNWLASFLATLIPVNLSLLLQPQKKLKRTFLLINLVAMFLALLYTQSRSGLLGLLAALLVLISLIIANRRQKPWPLIKGRLLLPLGLLAVTLLLAGSIYSPKLTELWQPAVVRPQIRAAEGINSLEEGGSASSEIRKVVWQGALKVWQRYPIFGSGPETFAYSYYLDRPVEHNLLSEWNLLYNKAHNELLNFLATTGLVGLGTYLMVWLAAAVLVWRALRRGQAAASILGLSSALVAMFVANFFGFSTVSSNLLLFSFLAFLVLYIDRQAKTTVAEVTNNRAKQLLTLPRLLFSWLLILAALLTLNGIGKIWLADFHFTAGKNYYQSGKALEGIQLIETAIGEAPQEALFYDELASIYADLALQYANQDATASALLSKNAIALSDQVLALNNRHLNFYKSRTSIFLKLGQLDVQYYQRAKATLQQAIYLAPTDAKLYYNLALIETVLGENEQALQDLQYSIQIKANYAQARNELANLYIQRQQLEKAREQYLYLLEKINPQDSLVQEKLRLLEASLSAQKN